MKSLREQLRAASVPTVRPVKFSNVDGLFIKDLAFGDVITADAPTDLNDEEKVEYEKYRRAKMFARLMCDSAGKSVYNPDNESDIAEILQLPTSLIAAVNEAGQAEGNALAAAHSA